MGLTITLYGEMDTGNGPQEVPVFEANITHNLGNMATQLGIYHKLWRPEEIGVEYAEALAQSLTLAVKELKERPAFYSEFNAENGWGTLEQFVPWLTELLAACIEHPRAKVIADR